MLPVQSVNRGRIAPDDQPIGSLKGDSLSRAVIVRLDIS